MAHGYVATITRLLQVSPEDISSTLCFRGISTDSRTLQPGMIFVALRGEHFDGHAFIPAAMEKGAVAVISEREESVPHWRVPDTLAAYQQLGRWWRSQFSIPIIAITGSTGKTSTKDMAAAALSRYGPVLKSAANHNNDIGLTQTLLQIRSEHRFVVVEMAMRGHGEIARLARTAQPTHALITNVGTAHIGRLGSITAIAQAKCELLEIDSLQTAILNAEDPLLLKTAAKVWSGLTLTYGLTQGHVQGQWLNSDQRVIYRDQSLPVPYPGRHQALNWMGVIALIQSLSLDLQGLQAPLHVPADPEGRNRILSLSPDLVILDETYNAAPEAMKAALVQLKDTPGRRHWAILGPMRELGDFAASLYAEVGKTAAYQDLHRVLLLDPEGELQPLAAALPPTKVRVFRDGTALVQLLLAQVQPGDRILFKAARAIQLERLLQQFLNQWPQPPSGG
ncbi:MAG: UDP-N-acetylmuramoyl-tripeptide--D-alanyl-D-alanine ligase [Synechococcaceae cyanobacterium SM2_3_1]|nr:UDP-N-acetylmuramoyl-tripeptide--D-alanyl-D-alanine ligase [Synechococcaceae cyanobacterium SM2_3_1]